MSNTLEIHPFDSKAQGERFTKTSHFSLDQEPVSKQELGYKIMIIIEEHTFQCVSKTVHFVNELVFGRSEKSDVTISDMCVGESHARLVIKEGVIFIEDLRSKNGTYIYVNDDLHRIQGLVELHQNARIKMGNTILKCNFINRAP